MVESLPMIAGAILTVLCALALYTKLVIQPAIGRWA